MQKLKKKLNRENLVELKEKTSLRSVFKGDLPTRSFGFFLGGGGGGGPTKEGAAWMAELLF